MMSPESALNLLDSVCARFAGTRDDHRALSEAVLSLRQLVEAAKAMTPAASPTNGRMESPLPANPPA